MNWKEQGHRYKILHRYAEQKSKLNMGFEPPSLSGKVRHERKYFLKKHRLLAIASWYI
jgi:hypothetical protein